MSHQLPASSVCVDRQHRTKLCSPKQEQGRKRFGPCQATEVTPALDSASFSGTLLRSRASSGVSEAGSHPRGSPGGAEEPEEGASSASWCWENSLRAEHLQSSLEAGWAVALAGQQRMPPPFTPLRHTLPLQTPHGAEPSTLRFSPILSTAATFLQEDPVEGPCLRIPGSRQQLCPLIHSGAPEAGPGMLTLPKAEGRRPETVPKAKSSGSLERSRNCQSQFDLNIKLANLVQ